MKKVLGIITALLLVFAVAGCAQRRAQDPVLEGYDTEPRVALNGDFDPLEGVKAYDRPGGKDISDKIEVRGWDDDNLTVPGYYDYSLYVENDAELFVEVSIKLTVLTADGKEPTNAPVLKGVKVSETHFIGSGTWDPTVGVTAETYEGVDITDKLEITGLYLLDTVGTYSIVYVIVDEGIRTRATLTLNVVSSEIPNELSKTQPITITFNHANGDSLRNLMLTYSESFLAEMKDQGYNNITINIPDGAGNYDTLKNNMINQITAGAMPNMVQGYPDHVAEYLNGKAVLNLNPYIQHEKWGLVGEHEFTDIIESYRSENSQYDTSGTFYSLPFNKSTEVMTYNKTALDWVADKRLLAQNPAATESEKEAAREAIVPETWQEIIDLKDDLLAYAETIITKAVNEDKNVPAGQKQEEIAKQLAMVVPAAYDSAGNGFITFARQWGGKYTAINPDYSGQYLWADDPNTFKAMQFLKDNKDVITLPDFWDQQYASTPFLEQQTFITVGSSAGIRYNDPAGDFVLGAAPIPYNADMPENRAVIQQGTNISLLKTGTAQDMLASWLFLRHMIKIENTTHWAMNTGYLPVRTLAYESDIYQKFLNDPSANDQLISLSANAAYLQTSYMYYDPAFIGSSRARTQVGAALVRIVTGDGNIQAALDEAYSEANLGG